LFAELDLLWAQATNFTAQLDQHRTILTTSIAAITTDLQIVNADLQTLRAASQATNSTAMQAMSLSEACTAQIKECKDATSQLQYSVHSVKTMVEDFIGNTTPGNATDLAPSPSVAEAFATADTALQEGLSAMEQELGASLDRHITSQSASTTTGVRFSTVTDRWCSLPPYDSDAAYARSQSPGTPAVSSSPSSTDSRTTATCTTRMGHSSGDGVGGGDI